MVFSEADLIPKTLINCKFCSKEEKLYLFEQIVYFMSFTTIHTHFFFKFQSITTTVLPFVLEVFPSTPWVFLFRSPTQVLMSHLKGGGRGAPCLRSKGRSEEVKAILLRSNIEREKDEEREEDKGNFLKRRRSSGNSDIEWCAAHLEMLCSSALNAIQNGSLDSNSSSSIHRKGVLLDYSSLPGSILRVILPHFEIHASPSSARLLKIRQVTSLYSKGRGESVGKVFLGDSERKEKEASDEINSAGRRILGDSFDRMRIISEQSIWKYLGHEEKDLLGGTEGNRNWSMLSAFPEKERSLIAKSLHSSLSSIFPPTHPFGNSHHSIAKDSASTCSSLPDKYYPNMYYMTDILNHWNTDVTEIPPFHHDTLCHFDYSDPSQLELAFAYRQAEVPFVVYNVPEVDSVVRKWSDLEYLRNRLGNAL